MRLVTFKHGAKNIHFIFGPYRERVPGTFGVRLTEDHQLNLPCNLHFPIPDFGVPKARAFEDFLIEIIKVADNGAIPYVGCYGGIGRTGTVVAALARTLLVTQDPVTWARANYLSHAVETQEQRRLVDTFDVNRVREATFCDVVATGDAPTKEATKKSLQLVALWASFLNVFARQRKEAGR